ncbi:MAG: hypothetical protein KDD98_06915 [Sphingomonadaceae bacterium]|nr:hypothetical protein [Sphingomonadaceae bacterium]
MKLLIPPWLTLKLLLKTQLQKLLTLLKALLKLLVKLLKALLTLLAKLLTLLLKPSPVKKLLLNNPALLAKKEGRCRKAPPFPFACCNERSGWLPYRISIQR